MQCGLKLFLLAAGLLLSVCAGLAQSGTTGSLKWSIKNGTLTISGSGAMPNYSLSDDAPWHFYFDSITTVVIGDNVTSIGNYAFFMCYMTSVTIGHGVRSIGNYAFFLLWQVGGC